MELLNLYSEMFKIVNIDDKPFFMAQRLLNFLNMCDLETL